MLNLFTHHRQLNQPLGCSVWGERNRKRVLENEQWRAEKNRRDDRDDDMVCVCGCCGTLLASNRSKKGFDSVYNLQ
jgi:hypothetical protein